MYPLVFVYISICLKWNICLTCTLNSLQFFFLLKSSLTSDMIRVFSNGDVVTSSLFPFLFFLVIFLIGRWSHGLLWIYLGRHSCSCWDGKHTTLSSIWKGWKHRRKKPAEGEMEGVAIFGEGSSLNIDMRSRKTTRNRKYYI